MAKKDFDEYFLKMTAQHEQYKNILKELSEEVNKGMTDIDFYDNMEKQFQPFIQNYERLKFIKFLLDQPNKKSKLPQYRKAIKNSLSHLENSNSTEEVLRENENIIKGIKR